MKQSDIDELLAALYLRLNGYLTTGLIIHSDKKGEAKGEFDCLAIRLPHHRQDDRAVESAPFLETQTSITDLIVCEVKSDISKVSFNKPPQTNIEVLEKMLQWVGLFQSSKVRSVAERLQPLFRDDAPADRAKAGICEGKARVRALLCCPRMEVTDDRRWCLTGDEIFRYIEKCFNPVEERPSCSVRYNFEQWGYPLKPVIRWFKGRKGGNSRTLTSLYECFEDQPKYGE